MRLIEVGEKYGRNDEMCVLLLFLRSMFLNIVIVLQNYIGNFYFFFIKKYREKVLDVRTY